MRPARLVLVLLGLLLLAPATAAASTYKVTTTGDSNDGACTAALCSLRDAVVAANADPGSTVTVPDGHYTLSLGELLISAAGGGTTTIQGASTRGTIVDGGGSSRVFNINTNQTLVAMQDLTVTGGNSTLARPAPFAGDGGGILNQSNLSLLRVAVRGNHAEMGGGGILTPFESGVVLTTTIRDSTISNNTVSGGLVDGQGGGIAAFGDLMMANSTVTGNSVSNPGINEGGGIVHARTVVQTAVPVAQLNNVTISGNSVAGPVPMVTNFGGGFAGQALGGVALLEEFHASNTIIAGNTVDGATQDCGMVITTQTSHNLSSDSTCGFTDPGSITGKPSVLGALANNGGPTDTLALLKGSPAIDAGDSASCIATDQRGFTRPAGACDIGAYEVGDDLLVKVRAKPRKPDVGHKVIYKLTVSNLGFTPVSKVVLTDHLGLRARRVKPKATCKFKKSGRHSRRKRFLTCPLGTIRAGASRTIKVKVRPKTAKKLHNTAKVYSAGSPVDPAHSVAKLRTKVR